MTTDELRELLANHDNGRRENETCLAYEDRLFDATRRLENLAPFLAAEVLRLRELEEASDPNVPGDILYKIISHDEMHEIAFELGYPSVLEALEDLASKHIGHH